jgi:hypothetical protein
MNDITVNGPVLISEPFTIARVTLLPGDVVGAPLGEVLTTGFSGSTAFAWVKHHPGEQAVMNLVTLPTGGPFSLETAAGFKTAIHVSSFFKKGTIRLTKDEEQGTAVAWHVFAWHPIEGSATFSEPASTALN